MAVLEASLLALWKPDVEGLYLTDKDTKSAKIGRRARENAQIHNKKYGHLESSTEGRMYIRTEDKKSL